MYWLNGIASQLSLECTSTKDTNDTTKDGEKKSAFPKSLDITAIKPSHHASLFITCTRTAIYLWSVKVTCHSNSTSHLHKVFTYLSFESQLPFLLLWNDQRIMSKSLEKTLI
ncbi:unnamed protein product [Mucor hiemalis]